MSLLDRKHVEQIRQLRASAHEFIRHFRAQLLANIQTVIGIVKEPDSVSDAQQAVGERFNQPKVYQGKQGQLLAQFSQGWKESV